MVIIAIIIDIERVDLVLNTSVRDIHVAKKFIEMEVRLLFLRSFLGMRSFSIFLEIC